MASAEEIDSLIAKYKRPFTSRPTYTDVGDCVELYFEDADCYADRVDCWLTLYRAFDDRRVVGFMLKNIKTLLSRFDALGLECRVRAQSCTLRVHALVAYVPWVDPESARRKQYHDVLSRLRDKTDATVELSHTDI